MMEMKRGNAYYDNCYKQKQTKENTSELFTMNKYSWWLLVAYIDEDFSNIDNMSLHTENQSILKVEQSFIINTLTTEFYACHKIFILHTSYMFCHQWRYLYGE